MIETNCPFCDQDKIASRVIEIDDALVFEPLNPITPGHLLVVPKQHVSDFAASPYVTAQTMQTAAKVVAIKGGDYNLITSKGAAATQTVGHFHVHLVPRCEGDNLKLPWTPPMTNHPIERETHHVALVTFGRPVKLRMRDTDGSPTGRDAQRLDGEAATAGAEGIAQTSATIIGERG